MWVRDVPLGANRDKVGNIVLPPRAVADAGTPAGFLGAGLQSTTIAFHDGQSGPQRRFGLRLLVLEILDPPIAIVPKFPAHLVRDPPDLPSTDAHIGVGERFRGLVEGRGAHGGADDFTKDRGREVVRVEP